MIAVSISGIESLLQRSLVELRNQGIEQQRYTVDRISTVYLLALSITKAQDRDKLNPNFLEAVLPLLTSSRLLNVFCPNSTRETIATLDPTDFW